MFDYLWVGWHTDILSSISELYSDKYIEPLKHGLVQHRGQIHKKIEYKGMKDDTGFWINISWGLSAMEFERKRDSETENRERQWERQRERETEKERQREREKE